MRLKKMHENVLTSRVFHGCIVSLITFDCPVLCLWLPFLPPVQECKIFLEWRKMLCVSEAWVIWDAGKRKNKVLVVGWQKGGLRSFCVSTFKCVCCKKKIVVQWTQRERLPHYSLPTSYRTAVCVCMGGEGEKEEGREIIFSHYSTHCSLTRVDSDGQTSATFSKFTGWRAVIVRCSCQFCLSTSGWAVTSTPSLLSACLYSYLWNDGWA